MLFVPDFTPTLITEPGSHPYSALGFCSVLNSWMASMGRSEDASPVRYEAFNTLAPVLGDIWERPSIIVRSAPVRMPLVLWSPVPDPTGVTTPGRSCSKRSKLRPFRGRERMA